jgi:hypothetical protein
MRPSSIKKGPVITILTQNQNASCRMQNLLQSLFETKIILPPSLSPSSTTTSSFCYSHDNDELNQIIHPFMKCKFNSSVSICESTNTIFHFLSIDHCNNKKNFHNNHKHNNTNNSNSSSSRNDNEDSMTILVLTPGPNNNDIKNTSMKKEGQEGQEEKEEHKMMMELDLQMIIIHKYISKARNSIYSQIVSNHNLTPASSSSLSSHSTSTSTISTTATRDKYWNYIWWNMKIAFLKYTNYYNSISNSDLLAMDLPYLDLTTCASTSINNNDNDENDNKRHGKKKNKFYLRELVIPFSNDSTYHNDDKSLLQILLESNLHRPKIGLFQWINNPNNDHKDNNGKDNESRNNKSTKSNDGIVIRPLPSASNDMKLPPTTFIFQCDSLYDIPNHISNYNHNHNHNDVLTLSKVGFNGYQKNNGQLRIETTSSSCTSRSTPTTIPNMTTNETNIFLCNDIPMIHNTSLEFRFCDAKELSTSFAEAQESLLAGSLDDLQNVNVMVEGNDRSNNDNTISNNRPRDSTRSSESKLDLMNGLGDCWVEFRANMKKPKGFFQKKKLGFLDFSSLFALGKNNKKSKGGGKRIVKAPNLPYE